MIGRRYHTQAGRHPRRRWLDMASTFFWVAAVTILVWVYSDMEFTKSAEVTFTVRLTTGKSPDLVLLSPSQTKVVFELRGNRGQLDPFVAKYDGTAIDYDVSSVLGSGVNQRLSAAEILNAALDIEKKGFTIRSASPQNITGIDIDRLVHKEVPVAFDFTGADLTEKPKVTLGVSVVRNRWERIQAILKDNPSQGVLRTVKTDLKNEEKGKPINVTAEIIPSIAGVPVEPDQKTVTVTVEIREFTDKKTIQVTVRFLMPYTWLEDGTWDRYRLLRETQQTSWVPDVEVTGPREDLLRLKAEDVEAYIVLTEDDKKFVESWLTRTVRFRLPPDLRVKLVGEPPIVKFKLEARKAGPVTPPTGP